MRLSDRPNPSLSNSTVWIAPRATDEENEYGTRIDPTEGDRSWRAPPPQRWILHPPALKPLASSSSSSLTLLCLENIAQNITRYDPSSFHGVGERYMRMIWVYLEERFGASKGEEQEREGDDGRPWQEQDLFLWLLHLQTGRQRHSGASSPLRVMTSGTSSTRGNTQLVPITELLAYLPTSSPLTLLQLPPTPTYTLLTSLSLSSHLLTDTTIVALRNLPWLSFLFLLGCTGVTNAGIKSLAMSLDYEDAVVLTKNGQIDKTSETGRGCWRLRGLWLDGCKRITDHAVRDLTRWPMLNVLSLANTGMTNQPTFPLGSHWTRAIPLDAAFLIPRVASPYHHAASDPQVDEKFKAYRSRWPGRLSVGEGNNGGGEGESEGEGDETNVGILNVVGLGQEELMRFKGEREVRRKIRTIKRDTGQTDEDQWILPIPVEVDHSHRDGNPGWRMDRSMAFTTDHGTRPPWGNAQDTRQQRYKYSGGTRTGGSSRSGDDELDWLYLRPPPTIESIRQEFVDRAALRADLNLRDRARVVRPRSNVTAQPSASTSTSTSTSPFSLSTKRSEITIQKRKGRGSQLSSIPFEIPQSTLRAQAGGARGMKDYGWETLGSTGSSDFATGASSSSTPTSLVRTASQLGCEEEPSKSPRRKGFSMFKKAKR